jgi:hypothetical protein
MVSGTYENAADDGFKDWKTNFVFVGKEDVFCSVKLIVISP